MIFSKIVNIFDTRCRFYAEVYHKIIQNQAKNQDFRKLWSYNGLGALSCFATVFIGMKLASSGFRRAVCRFVGAKKIVLVWCLQHRHLRGRARLSIFWTSRDKKKAQFLGSFSIF